jgi:hypothetical protein
MDPLSVVASVASLLEIGMRVSKELNGVIHTWKTAAPSIIALYNEITDLNVVLDHTRSAQETVQAKGAKYDAAFLEAMNDNLRQCEKVMVELDTLVVELRSMGNLKMKYKWLRKNSVASEMQTQLRDIRVRINELLVAYNVLGAPLELIDACLL